jgi:hypothetical protein
LLLEFFTILINIFMTKVLFFYAFLIGFRIRKGVNLLLICYIFVINPKHFIHKYLKTIIKI